jgi:hypothetical protein
MPAGCGRPTVRHIFVVLVALLCYTALFRVLFETTHIHRTLSTWTTAARDAGINAILGHSRRAMLAMKNASADLSKQLNYTDFSIILSLNESALSVHLLAVMARALDQVNVTYFMTGGTLLGSYRHHGRIPWDDDVDMIINAADKKIAWNTLTSISANYGVFYYKNRFDHLWKFQPLWDDVVATSDGYRWPNIDIFFYAEDATHVWNSWVESDRWAKKIVFPLRRRPYEGLMLRAPCNTEAVLATTYDIFRCFPLYYDHFHDTSLRTRPTVLCRELYHIFPFVRQRKVSVGQNLTLVTETLMRGNETLSQVTLQDGCK